MKKIILIIFLSVAVNAFAQSLPEYKEKVKKENLKTFYQNKITRTYNKEAVLNALIGVEGNLGQIRFFIKPIQIKRAFAHVHLGVNKQPNRRLVRALIL